MNFLPLPLEFEIVFYGHLMNVSPVSTTLALSEPILLLYASDSVARCSFCPSVWYWADCVKWV